MAFAHGTLNHSQGPKEIAAWAARRGFRLNENQTYSANVADVEIVIELRKRDLTVTAKSADGEGRLIRAFYRNLELDTIDMLHGASLSTSFHSVYIGGTDVPWFPPELKAALDKLRNEQPAGRRQGQAEMRAEVQATGVTP